MNSKKDKKKVGLKDVSSKTHMTILATAQMTLKDKMMKLRF